LNKRLAAENFSYGTSGAQMPMSTLPPPVTACRPTRTRTQNDNQKPTEPTLDKIDMKKLSLLKKTFLLFSRRRRWRCGVRRYTIKVGMLHSLSGTMAISETSLAGRIVVHLRRDHKAGGIKSATRAHD